MQFPKSFRGRLRKPLRSGGACLLHALSLLNKGRGPRGVLYVPMIDVDGATWGMQEAIHGP